MGKFGLYSDIRPRSYPILLWSIVRALLVDFGVLSVAIVLLRQTTYSRIFLLSFAGLCFTTIAICRIFIQLYFDKIAKKGFSTYKILVVGDQKRGKFVAGLLNSQLSWGHEVIGTMPLQNSDINGTVNDFAATLRSHTVDEVVFALDGDRNVNLSAYLNTCRK